MDNFDVQQWTGVAGIVFVALSMIILPLYFIYSDAPPKWNVLARILINMFALLVLIAFLLGFRNSISPARPNYEWLGTMCMVVGLVHVGLTYVADSLQAGSVLGKTERLDPTLVGAGAEGSLIIYGPISRLLEAAFLISAGSAIWITGLLPEWIVWLAYALSVFQLAFVPTIFSRTVPAYF